MSDELEVGRPGHLTPEQDEKLREFWGEVYKVFNHEKTRHSSESETPKKKAGWFGSYTEPVDPEDKYGQKQQYLKALKDYSPAVIRASFWSMLKADHPDALLLRFLRARKWDVEKALIMMLSTFNWRAAEAHVDDDIMREGEEGSLRDAESSDPKLRQRGKDLNAQLRLGKMYMHGIDLKNRPIIVIRVQYHKTGEYSNESLERGIIYITETARLTLKPPVDTVFVIFDMTGFGMASMDFNLLKFLFKIFEANYPESLSMVLVHNAPWIFQGAWRVIRGWLDPDVRDKVAFTNTAADMEPYIAPQHIPKAYGGSEDWEYSYVDVVPGENSRMEDVATRDKIQAERDIIAKELDDLTQQWLKDPHNAETQRKRQQAADDLKENYWKLDPYIRARSLFDRVGILKEGADADPSAWNTAKQ